jgi:hypothetical protein
LPSEYFLGIFAISAIEATQEITDIVNESEMTFIPVHGGMRSLRVFKQQ